MNLDLIYKAISFNDDAPKNRKNINRLKLKDRKRKFNLNSKYVSIHKNKININRLYQSKKLNCQNDKINHARKA